MNRLGQLIRERREAAGLSQDDVAQRLHLDRSVYTKYEGSKRELPWVARINALAAHLPVSTEDLLAAAGVNLTPVGAAKLPRRLVEVLLAMPPEQWESLADILSRPASGPPPQGRRGQ